MKPSEKKVAGIILAAGTASRMGKTKQLLAFKGDTILGTVIRSARASKLHEIVLVLGHDADKIRSSLNLAGVSVVLNTAYQKGQSTSLIAGLEKISPACDAALFLLADQPLVTPVVINRMIHAFKSADAPIIIPCYKGQRGNPVLIAGPLFPRIASLTADTGARALFQEFSTSIVTVAFPDESILMDVDTPNDYKNLLSGK